METPQENQPDLPQEKPLYSTGKKIVFIGALLIWGGFFLPWFSSFALGAKPVDHPGGAEIPYLAGWLVLGMAFLAVILPDSFPELGKAMLKSLCFGALALGAAMLVLLVLHNPAGVKSGVLCNIAGYVFLFVGVIMDFAAPAHNDS